MRAGIRLQPPIGGREKPKGGFLFLPRRLTRSAFLKWLRRTHAWFGLWGAALGLLFGITGFLLNHRAGLKIPAAKLHESTVQIALSTPVPDNAQALAAFLQRELHLTQAPTIKVEESRPAPWGDGSVRQPERWQINFATPKVSFPSSVPDLTEKGGESKKRGEFHEDLDLNLHRDSHPTRLLSERSALSRRV